MPIKLDVLIDEARKNCAYDYANLELARHAFRMDMQHEDPALAYYFSTETKRHMSSLMYKAFVEGRGVTISQAAEKLRISRQAASSILNETTEAGWTVRRRDRFMFSDKSGELYTQRVSEVLLTMSTNLSEKTRKLMVLQEILSTYLSLTSDDRSSDTVTSEVKNGKA